MPELIRQEIFIATPEDPNHEYTFPNVFNEVSSGACGFYLIGLTKVQTALTEKGDLIIQAFIGEKFIAKDFVFNFLESTKRVGFYQKYCNNKPTSWCCFEIFGGEQLGTPT